MCPTSGGTARDGSRISRSSVNAGLPAALSLSLGAWRGAFWLGSMWNKHLKDVVGSMNGRAIP